MTVRFSDFAGIPAVADNDPQGASPRGFAVRFHLDAHVLTDIVAHSTDDFPARTAEGLMDFLNAVIATHAADAHPNAIERFLATHPAALAFRPGAKTNPDELRAGVVLRRLCLQVHQRTGRFSRFGRYRILPLAGNEYLDDGGG